MPSVKSVEEMMAGLSGQELIIVKKLRNLIKECLPKAEEKGYYGEGVMFYRHHRLICFIWPWSVYWGPKRTEETQKAKGVTLGFNQGNLMSNENDVLKSEGRKQVYVMYFHSVKEVIDEQVKALLFEAGMIDDAFGMKRKRKKKL